LTTRPKTGRAVAGEFNSPRPSRDRSAGINTRTLGASVRVGGSTPPDNSRRTAPKTRVLRGVAFPNRLSQRWIKVFNPSLWVSDCINCTNRGLVNLSTAFTLGVKWFERLRLSLSRKSSISVRPRGTRPAQPVDRQVVSEQRVPEVRTEFDVDRCFLASGDDSHRNCIVHTCQYGLV
jgi:hypothetical protein